MDDVRPRPWGRWQRKLLRRGTTRGALIGGAGGLATGAIYGVLTAGRVHPGFLVLQLMLWALVGMFVGRLLGAVVVAMCAVLRQFFENVF
jgi:hypothetical protein